MKNKVIVLFIILGSCLGVNAQNLIPNGSFEEFKPNDNQYAPKQFNNLIGGWEVFTACNRYQKPGILTLNKEERSRNIWPDGGVVITYQNYQRTAKSSLCETVFQVPLKQLLQKDSLYHVSFYIHLFAFEKGSGESIVDPKLVQFFARDKKLKSENEIGELKKEKAIGELAHGKTHDDYTKKFWPFVSFNFKANGGEKFLIFGTIDTIYSKYWCSFWFDDMKLEQVKGDIMDIASMKIGSTIVVENILFETNKSVLQTSSHTPLNQLVTELMKNPAIKIEISGHTDNTGNKENNLELSGLRAKAVVDYLVEKGIDTTRLSFKGYGDSKPIADNTSEEGRKQNRRVEITVIEK